MDSVLIPSLVYSEKTMSYWKVIQANVEAVRLQHMVIGGQIINVKRMDFEKAMSEGALKVEPKQTFIWQYYSSKNKYQDKRHKHQID